MAAGCRTRSVQFTCFTSTNVPILTPEELSAGHASAHASGGRGGGGAWQQVEGDGAWEVELNRLLSTIGEYIYIYIYM